MNLTPAKGNPTGHGSADDCMKYVIDQGYSSYTAENHAVWKTLYNRQKEIVKGRACDEFLAGMDALGVDDSGIPSFEDASKILKKKTGWEVVAVDGLIPDLPFFKLLSERKFPAGNFIRSRDRLDYIEEPDVFHDFFGHVPLLANPVFADYMQAYGEGGCQRAVKFDTVMNLARLYWYTVEFGLIKTPEGMRIYGAGILSSGGETVFSLESDSPNRIGFNLNRIMRTEYRVDDYQQTYFVIDSFEQLFKETYFDFTEIYKDMKADVTSYGAADVLASDKVIHNGTQEYAQEEILMKEEFNKNAPGSAYGLGLQDSRIKVVLMHGQAGSAESLREDAEVLSRKLPQAEVIVPNGSYLIPKGFFNADVEAEMESGYSPFTWYSPDRRNTLKTNIDDPLVARLNTLKSDPSNHIHLVGFSMGGFRAAEEFLKAPDDFKGAVLHSSAILGLPKGGIQNHYAETKPRLLTLMGCKDPYLRQKWVMALLPVHYINQWKVNRTGISAKTVFQWNLAHEMTDKSLTRVAQHISDLEAG